MAAVADTMPSNPSLVTAANSSEDVAGDLASYVREVADLGSDITAAVSELYAISSLCRQVNDCAATNARRFQRVVDDVRLVVIAHSKTLKDMRTILGKASSRPGTRRDVYKRLWQELGWIFKDAQNDLTLQKRLHSYKSFLQKILDSLDLKRDSEANRLLSDLRVEMNILLNTHQNVAVRIQKLEQFDTQSAAAAPAQRAPAYPGSSPQRTNGGPVPAAGRRPAIVTPSPSYESQYAPPPPPPPPPRPAPAPRQTRPVSVPNYGPFAPPRTRAANDPYGHYGSSGSYHSQMHPKRASVHYADGQVPMYNSTYQPTAGSPISPSSPVSSSTTLSDSNASGTAPISQCFGVPMANVKMDESESEMIRLCFENDFNIKLWRNEETLAARLVCLVGKAVKFADSSNFQTSEFLSNLTISRSSFKVLLRTRRNGQIWASLVFKKYDNLVLFYAMFLSLRQRGPGSPSMLPTETFIEGEKMIFSASIADQSPSGVTGQARLQLRVLKDYETNSIRLSACVKDGKFQDLPMWTIFLDELATQTGWAGQPVGGNPHVVLMQGIKLFGVDEKYQTAAYPSFQVYFLGSDSPREFLRTIWGLRVGHL